MFKDIVKLPRANWCLSSAVILEKLGVYHFEVVHAKRIKYCLLLVATVHSN